MQRMSVTRNSVFFNSAMIIRRVPLKRFFLTIFDCYEQVLKHLYPTPQKMPRMVHNPLSTLPKKKKKNVEKEPPIPQPKDVFNS